MKQTKRSSALRRRSVSVLLVGATSAAALLALSSPAQAAGSTKITFRVSGCEGCRFIAHNGRNPAHSWRVVAKSTAVANSRATMRVPRGSTPEMSFEVRHPDGLRLQNAIPFVAMNRHKYNNICWGVNTGAHATLKINVVTFSGENMDGTPGTFISAWLASIPRPKFPAGINGYPVCS